jgi:hypothetical protein
MSVAVVMAVAWDSRLARRLRATAAGPAEAGSALSSDTLDNHDAGVREVVHAAIIRLRRSGRTIADRDLALTLCGCGLERAHFARAHSRDQQRAAAIARARDLLALGCRCALPVELGKVMLPASTVAGAGVLRASVVRRAGGIRCSGIQRSPWRAGRAPAAGSAPRSSAARAPAAASCACSGTRCAAHLACACRLTCRAWLRSGHVAAGLLLRRVRAAATEHDRQGYPTSKETGDDHGGQLV